MERPERTGLQLIEPDDIDVPESLSVTKLGFTPGSVIVLYAFSGAIVGRATRAKVRPVADINTKRHAR